MTKRIASLLSAFLLAAGLLAPTVSGLAQAQEQDKEKEKKKPRKVWTNDDLSGLGGRINIVGQEPPPPPEAKPAPEAATGTFPWEELDYLYELKPDLERKLETVRGDLARVNEELPQATEQFEIDSLLEERNAYEQEIARRETELEEINARIAELEKQTKGKKRPPKAPAKPKPAPAPEEGEEAPEKPAEEPAEEPPPPPPPPAR